MPISNDLFLAILAMDSYNRGYEPGINLTATGVSGTQIGTATIGMNSTNPLAGIPDGVAAGFFAQSYTLANGQTVISYRGTDNLSLLSGSNDILNGWVTGAGVAAA